MNTAELIAFGCIVAAFAILPFLEIRRESSAIGGAGPRITTNFLMGLMVLAISAALPIGSVAAARFAQVHHLGLFHAVAAPWPLILATLLAARTFANYWVHRASHTVPLFWRFHRVHHCDRAMDLSTALRNHPVELLLTIPTLGAVVMLLGPPIPVVLAADTILFVSVLWHHADIALPAWADRLFGAVLNTPSLHRVHHSALRAEHDRNYGDLLIVWDRLFGSYAGPAHPDLKLGLADDADTPPDRLLPQLARPFRR